MTMVEDVPVCGAQTMDAGLALAADWNDDDLSMPVELKGLPADRTSSPLTGVIGHDDTEGTITALVAISGVPDEVGDVIVPGSLDKAIKRLRPKGVMNHNWATKVSKLIWAEELMPGDPRLPPTTPQGDPWPRAAGGLMVKAKYNLEKKDGQDAYSDAKFYEEEECFSIGYKVRPGGSYRKNGKRYLTDYHIFEWSQVLHGAHPLATLTGVKSLSGDTDDDTWYTGDRSGAADEGTFMPDEIELKVRIVRDATFWGLPYGTPIRAGMRPRGRTQAASAEEIARTTTPADDAESAPGQPVAKPGGQTASDAAPPGPGVASALAALRERYTELTQRQDSNAAALLGRFAAVGADVRASDKGELAAVHNGSAWVVIDTLNAGYLPGLPGDVPAETVDRILTELADSGIPWGDLDARRKRWSDPKRKTADQDTVRKILAGATPFGEPTVADARRDAEDAISDRDRDALADALTRMGLPEDQDPHEVAGGLLAIPTESVAKRLDALAGAATRAANTDTEPGARGTNPRAGDSDGDKPTVAPHAGQQGRPAPKPDEAQTTPRGDDSLSDVKPKPEGRYKPTGNVNLAYIATLTDEQLEAESNAAHERHMRARRNGLPRNSVEYTDSRTAATIYGDEARKRAATALSPEAAPALDDVTAVAEPIIDDTPQALADRVRGKISDRDNPRVIMQTIVDAVSGDAQTRQRMDIAREVGSELWSRYTRTRAEAAGWAVTPKRGERMPRGLTRAEIVQRFDAMERMATVLDLLGVSATTVRDQNMTLPTALREYAKGGRSALRGESAPVIEIPKPPVAADRQAYLDALSAITRGDPAALIDALRRMNASDPEGSASEILAQPYPRDGHRILKEIRNALPVSGVASPSTPDLGVVPVPDDVAAAADRVRADAFGIEDGPDGEITLTEEAAARQDRVIALLGEGDGDDSIAGYTDAQLGSTRRDLVDELALQDELRRRDAERKREQTAARAAAAPAGTQPDQDTPTGETEDTHPKLRPGLAGAAEDLGDLLNADPRDPEAVRMAADRLVKLLRRAPADSKAFTMVRTIAGDDIHAAISAGRIKPGMLFAAAAALREERRVKRNAAARERRKARRIDRDRIRSMIGTVDAALRDRGLNPDDFGGAVASSVDPVGGTAVSAAAAPALPALALDERHPADLAPGDQDSTSTATEGVLAEGDYVPGDRVRVRTTGEVDDPHWIGIIIGYGREPGTWAVRSSRLGAVKDVTPDRITHADPTSPQSAQSPPAPAPHPQQVRRDERDARLAAEDNRVGRAQELMRQARSAADDGDFDTAFGHLDEAQRLNPERQRLWDKVRGLVTAQRDRADEGAQSSQEGGGSDGRRADRDPAADPAGGGRDSGTRPARGDVPEQAGAPDGSPARGDRARDEPDAGSATGRDGLGLPDRTGDAGGSGAGRSDERVRRSGSGTGAAEAPGESRGDASSASTDADGVVEQPAPDRGQVDAIPDTGTRFQPTDATDFAPAGKKAKLEANLAALRALRQIQAERRPATPDEQVVLARWAGWGGLPEVFDDDKPEYATQREELRGLLSDEEWNEARRGTLNAHYTDPGVVQSLWQAVRDLGFDGGRVLEPGSGSGTFIGFAPDSADMVGVELDSTTAAISHALYPDATIRNESFADTRIPAGSFDATIGNVPFGDFALNDRVHNPGRKLSIHNHFIKKSLALTKPGGVVAVLTSRYTLDAQNPAARRELAEMGDLLGAVRLPTGSHLKTSGTDVIEDVLIFRRREPGAEPLTPQDWVTSSKQDINNQQIQISDYFTAHPEQVLGEITAEAGRFGSGSLIVKGDRAMPDLGAALGRIVESARARGIEAAPRLAGLAELTAPDESRHEGHIGVDADGRFTQATGGAAVALPVPGTQAEELRALIGLRDTLQSLLGMERVAVSNSPELRALRADLNDAYDAYVARYGPINRYKLTKTGARSLPPVQHTFRRDPMSAIVRALEAYDPESGLGAKTDIFRKRSTSPREIPTTADTPEDALALSMDTYGEVRLDEIARMLGTDEATARERLGGLIFEQPPLTVAEQNAVWTSHLEDLNLLSGRTISADQVDLSTVGESVRAAGRLEPAAAYLSGNVRRKLAAAREAARHDTRFQANVTALEAVIPADLGVDEVDGRLGAAWIPANDVRDFLRDLIHDGDDKYGSIKVATSGGGIWTVEGANYGNRATEQWGTDRMTAGEIVQALLEQRSIKIEDTIEDADGKKKRYTNLEATVAAQAKAEEISERFSEWLWEDSDRTKRLLAAYNNQFNAIRLRSYDDVSRTFPGAADDWTPFDHQVAAVNRIVSEPCALLAHVVGAGKTGSMVMGAAELKRLGLARKPAIVVPNHMLEQFSREYLQIYPNAKILAAGTDDLDGERRREFVARAATGEWDCVILTQGAMKLIPMSQESMNAYIDRELATMRAQLAAAKEAGAGDTAQQATIKKMEKAVIKAEEAMKAKLDKVKDVGVSFEQTGIDYVFVDEAHQYSNLRTISNIAGAGATGSDIAQDLHMKIEYLRANNASGRVATFATGTPIRNTVTQAYIMQRFLRPDLLEEAGIYSFDQWAATFGQTVDEMELKPEGSGFRQTTRFAKFRNVPELLRLFHVFADVKMADDLNLPTPKLATGAVQNVVVPASDELRAYVKELGKRADDYRNGNPQKRPSASGGEDVDDMMLLISMDGRKAAMTMSNKLDVAADNIAKIWGETKDRPVPKDINDPAGGDDPPPGSMQIVFCDLFTPGGKDMNAYEELRKKLAARGMDPNGIRFMHEAKNDREKAELFAAARNGQVQVLIGSTEKMGVGTNVQRRAVALHHLDSPWRPSDVEQRDGRIMRQGNTNDEISIFRYVTEGSFDAYMWQTLERKKKFIDQIMRGRLGDIREIEDVGETALSYAEVKALATGNPMLIQKAAADAVIGKLGRLERQHARTQTNLRRDVPAYRDLARQADADAATYDEAITKRTDTAGDKFAMTVGGRKVTDRADATDALKRAIQDAIYEARYDDRPRYLATFGGHDLMGARETHYDKLGRRQYGITLSWDGLPGTIERIGPERINQLSPGTLTTLRNNLDGFESRRDIQRDRAQSLRDEADQMEARIGAPFQHADALKEARDEAARLQDAMEAAGLTDTGPADTGPSPGLAAARSQAARRVANMGRTGDKTRKERLKRFATPAAAGTSYASTEGELAAMGDGAKLEVFMTSDGVSVRPEGMKGAVDDPQALLDELAALDIPWGEGQWRLNQRWYHADYDPADYKLSYEERAKRAEARREAEREQERADREAIATVWRRHLVATEPVELTGVDAAKEYAAEAMQNAYGDTAEMLKRFISAGPRIPTYASGDGTIGVVTDTSKELVFFATGNGMRINAPGSKGPFSDPSAVADDLAALGIPLSDKEARLERWREPGRRAADVAAITEVFQRHQQAEEKSLDSTIIGVDELARARALTETKARGNDDETVESYTDTVEADLGYYMDASGTLQQVTKCPRCGGDIHQAAFGAAGNPVACPACGAKPAKVKVG